MMRYLEDKIRLSLNNIQPNEAINSGGSDTFKVSS